MIALVWLCLAIPASPLRSKRQLEAESSALRHQVIALRHQVRGRFRLTNLDRLVLVQFYRWLPSIFNVVAIIQTEIVIRWQRAGFHRSLDKDVPSFRAVQRAGNITSQSILGHQYVRI